MAGDFFGDEMGVRRDKLIIPTTASDIHQFGTPRLNLPRLRSDAHHPVPCPIGIVHRFDSSALGRLVGYTVYLDASGSVREIDGRKILGPAQLLARLIYRSRFGSENGKSPRDSGRCLLGLGVYRQLNARVTLRLEFRCHIISIVRSRGWVDPHRRVLLD